MPQTDSLRYQVAGLAKSQEMDLRSSPASAN